MMKLAILELGTLLAAVAFASTTSRAREVAAWNAAHPDLPIDQDMYDAFSAWTTGNHSASDVSATFSNSTSLSPNATLVSLNGTSRFIGSDSTPSTHMPFALANSSSLRLGSTATMPLATGASVKAILPGSKAFPTPSLGSTNDTSSSNSTDPSTSPNVTDSSAAPTVTPADPRFKAVVPCQKGLSDTDGGNGCGDCVNVSAIAPVELSKAELLDFDTSWFHIQDSTDEGPVAWWNVPVVPDTCKILIFAPVSDMEPPSGTPGLIVAIASQPGCYFTNAVHQMAVSYCCGNEECQAVGAGLMATDPRERRSDLAELMSSSGSSSKYQPDVDERQLLPKRDDNWFAFYSAEHTTSGTHNWVKPVEPDQWCEQAVPDEDSPTYLRAGQQQLIGQGQQCGAGLCSYSVDVTFTTSNSIESTTSREKSGSHTVSESIQAGYSWGPTFLATVGHDQTWGNAVTNSTAFTEQNSTATGLTSTLGVRTGTQARLGLVPQMSCSHLVSTCHNGSDTFPMYSEICEPVLGAPDGKSPVAYYFPVTIGSA